MLTSSQPPTGAGASTSRTPVAPENAELAWRPARRRRWVSVEFMHPGYSLSFT